MILGRDESAHVKLTFVILSIHKPFTCIQEPVSKNICQYFCKCIQRLTFYLCFRLFDILISIIHVLCKNERLINQYLMTLWNDSLFTIKLYVLTQNDISVHISPVSRLQDRVLIEELID